MPHVSDYGPSPKPVNPHLREAVTAAQQRVGTATWRLDRARARADKKYWNWTRTGADYDHEALDAAIAEAERELAEAKTEDACVRGMSMAGRPFEAEKPRPPLDVGNAVEVLFGAAPGED